MASIAPRPGGISCRDGDDGRRRGDGLARRAVRLALRAVPFTLRAVQPTCRAVRSVASAVRSSRSCCCFHLDGRPTASTIASEGPSMRYDSACGRSDRVIVARDRQLVVHDRPFAQSHAPFSRSAPRADAADRLIASDDRFDRDSGGPPHASALARRHDRFGQPCVASITQAIGSANRANASPNQALRWIAPNRRYAWRGGTVVSARRTIVSPRRTIVSRRGTIVDRRVAILAPCCTLVSRHGRSGRTKFRLHEPSSFAGFADATTLVSPGLI